MEEIKEELVFYPDFKHIAVISVTPYNWETSAIEAVTSMPLTPYPNQPLTRVNHYPDPGSPRWGFLCLENKIDADKIPGMKRFSLLLLIFLATCASPASPPSPPQPTPVALSVYFSPKGGATEAIVQQLDKAKTSILVQAYSFTSAPIAKALVAAHERRVKVEILLDKSHLTERYTNAPFFGKIRDSREDRLSPCHSSQ